MHRPTREIPVPRHLVAATERPTRAPEPAKTLSAYEWIADQIVAHELRGTLATTAELPAVDSAEKVAASPVLGIMDNANQEVAS